MANPLSVRREGTRLRFRLDFVDPAEAYADVARLAHVMVQATHALVRESLLDAPTLLAVPAPGMFELPFYLSLSGRLPPRGFAVRPLAFLSFLAVSFPAAFTPLMMRAPPQPGPRGSAPKRSNATATYCWPRRCRRRCSASAWRFSRPAKGPRAQARRRSTSASRRRPTAWRWAPSRRTCRRSCCLPAARRLGEERAIAVNELVYKGGEAVGPVLFALFLPWGARGRPWLCGISLAFLALMPLFDRRPSSAPTAPDDAAPE